MEKGERQIAENRTNLARRQTLLGELEDLLLDFIDGAGVLHPLLVIRVVHHTSYDSWGGGGGVKSSG